MWTPSNRALKWIQYSMRISLASSRIKRVFANKTELWLLVSSVRRQFDAELVQAAIGKIILGKAAGFDVITSEHLQHSHPLLTCLRNDVQLYDRIKPCPCKFWKVIYGTQCPMLALMFIIKVLLSTTFVVFQWVPLFQKNLNMTVLCQQIQTDETIHTQTNI